MNVHPWISADRTKMYEQDCKNSYELATDLYDLSVIWVCCLFLFKYLVSLEKTHYFKVKCLINATGYSCDIRWEPLWNDDKNKH